jgi:hypothetical protein
VTRVRPPTRHDRLKAKEIRTKEVRERQREGRTDSTFNPFFVPHLPFYLFYLVFNWSINNDNIKTFIFASPLFPVKTCKLGITDKS